MHVDEVPDPRNADRVAIAGCANQRRDVARVVLCRPDAVARNFERRKPDPFAPRRAVVIEIKAWMIDQDGEPAPDQHHHKKKIEEVAITDPERKTVRPCEVIRVYLRKRGNVRQPGERRPRSRMRQLPIKSPHQSRSEWLVESRCGSDDPLDSAPPVCGVKRNHGALTFDEYDRNSSLQLVWTYCMQASLCRCGMRKYRLSHRP